MKLDADVSMHHKSTAKWSDLLVGDEIYIWPTILLLPDIEVARTNNQYLRGFCFMRPIFEYCTYGV